MRLITRSDFDGSANLPFVDGCGLSFDHHSGEAERCAYKGMGFIKLSKRIVVTTLLTAMLLTQLGCSESAPVEEVVAPVATPEPIVYTTQEFSSSVGDKYRFAKMGTTEAYEEAKAGLKPVEGMVLALSGHQIYVDEKTGGRFIISEVNKTPISGINVKNLYAEKTGERINFVTDKAISEMEDILYNTQTLTDVLDNGKLGLANSEGRDINVVFNDRSFKLPNLVDKTPDGKYAIAVNVIAKATGMKDNDQTYARSGEQFYGIPTSMLPGISLQIEIPSTLNDYELMFDEETKDVFYTCKADKLKNACYVHEDFLKQKLGWEIAYSEEQDMLVIRTDDMYTNGVTYDKGVKDDIAKEVPVAEFIKAQKQYSDLKKDLVTAGEIPAVPAPTAPPVDKPSVPEAPKPEPTPTPPPVVEPIETEEPVDSEPVKGKEEAPAKQPPKNSSKELSTNEIRDIIKEGEIRDMYGNLLPDGSSVPSGGYAMQNGVMYCNGPFGMGVVTGVSVTEIVDLGEPSGTSWAD